MSVNKDFEIKRLCETVDQMRSIIRRLESELNQVKELLRHRVDLGIVKYNKTSTGWVKS